MKSLLYLVTTIFFIHFSYSQTIKGTVKTDNNLGIKSNILIKKDTDKKIIAEFFKTNENGEFSIQLHKQYNVVHIEITSFDYESITDSITNPKKDQVYNLNYQFKKRKINQLDEIVIKEHKFEVADDTTSFNLKQYKDGTEKKVEDIIKKLPGMEVDASGGIKYKGKAVTTVQLEGDNLFGSNYTIGTRNISVDMVEQIQAIDNYSENPLLKGIENSNNVAINLKLKKNKIDFSGNIDLNSGVDSQINPKNYINSTLLGISKRYKAFTTNSYNNIGVNTSPSDYFSNSANLEDVSNTIFKAKKVIPETSYNSNIDNNRFNLNNQFNSSLNTIYRFSKKVALKSNLSFNNDKIVLTEANNTNFQSTISYNEKTVNIKKPKATKADLKLDYNISSKSLIENELSLHNEVIMTEKNIVQNNGLLNTVLSSEDNFVKNNLIYTHKLNKSTAIQYNSIITNNEAPQNLIIEPSFLGKSTTQFSQLSKRLFLNKIRLLGNYKKNKYFIETGVINDKNLYTGQVLNEKEYLNDFLYKKSTVFVEIGDTYVFKKWNFQPLFLGNSIHQFYKSYDNTKTITKNNFSVNPSLNIRYNLNLSATVKANFSYEEKTPNIENLITNPVIINNRTIQKNILSLELIKNQNISLSYRYDNLYQSINSNIGITHNLMKNTYISAIDIFPNYSVYNFFQSPHNIETYNFNFSFEKLVTFLKTYIKHNSSYSINKYQNVINQGEIRNNVSNNYFGSIYFGTVLGPPVNFQNKLNYNFSKYSSVNSQIENITIDNSFKIIFKPNKTWLLSVNYDYFLPNSKNQDNFSFVDFELKFSPKSIKWTSFHLRGTNLLDNKFYTITNNSDFQTTIYQSNLLNRMILLNIELNF